MMSGSFSPPGSTVDVPGSSSQSHSASSSPSGAGEHHHHHHHQLQGSRRRQRGPRVRTTSDLSAMMMMSKAPENPTIVDTTASALAEGVGGMTLSSSSRSNTSSVLSRDGLNGRTCTARAVARSSQATVKHTTVSTEDFGRIASPALQLRRMKRRLLLEAVGQTYSNCDSIRNGGGSSSSRRYFNNAHNMIDRQDSDISSSSTLTSVGDE
mmetsp:Transcript_14540/g.35296  ORF Transcript_14540/g.35296 Transcript_14540/m.35296 type:complete len:210 (+) Transcript_14540:1815-2444(+)|eukprot:CAMPEP_0113458134 /NCGR_PEP_ID=MMETSP0014_2-20120614/9764_1 /TAXON_ID=2857 /ORGANISM="Nitzschia sp." /LENGTH=209 /DNA_ID=CAMNT_0000349645 /DNA_START=168 /DNA_END=797 /DNA_ORIENTATION=- /assembly_acc=CAM_ASM_000159